MEHKFTDQPGFLSSSPGNDGSSNRSNSYHQSGSHPYCQPSSTEAPASYSTAVSFQPPDGTSPHQSQGHFGLSQWGLNESTDPTSASDGGSQTEGASSLIGRAPLNIQNDLAGLTSSESCEHLQPQQAQHSAPSPNHASLGLGNRQRIGLFSYSVDSAYPHLPRDDADDGFVGQLPPFDDYGDPAELGQNRYEETEPPEYTLPFIGLPTPSYQGDVPLAEPLNRYTGPRMFGWASESATTPRMSVHDEQETSVQSMDSHHQFGQHPIMHQFITEPPHQSYFVGVASELTSTHVSNPTGQNQQHLHPSYTASYAASYAASNASLNSPGVNSPSPSEISRVSSAPPDPLACPECGKEYSGEYRKGNLARHIRLKHGEEEQLYVCEVTTCAREFKRQDARLKHYRRRHPELAMGPPVSRR